MYQKVLVPLDGSDLAECTLQHVESLVKRGFAGDVTLLNIVKFDIPWAERGAREPFDMEKMRESLMTASNSYLDKVAARLRSKGIQVTTQALEANRPARTIIEYAETQGMDLIVMASHGHSGFKKLLIGNVAFGVLHESIVPVLLIRPESCRPPQSTSGGT